VNYYNEHDPKAAAWLRELIKRGHIPDGIVDERSIEDVVPSELAGFTQCHFFAGIGGWSLALQLAGWPKDRPVWTGSCPCQPFSSAGKGAGFADERHLWPAFHHLISQCQPSVVFGEQVESPAGRDWLALVASEMESMGYAFGASSLCAAGVGAPHPRQRIFFVANSCRTRRQNRISETKEAEEGKAAKRGVVCQGQLLSAIRSEDGWTCVSCGLGVFDGCDHDHGELWCFNCGEWTYPFHYSPSDGCSHCGTDGVNKTLGFWRNADWIKGRNKRWYPVEPSTFPLAHGIPARVVRLRGYGNAIVPQVAATFIEATGLIQ